MRRMRDQGGVVAIVMALVLCFVLIPLAAIAVDLGMQRVARRDMQSVADVVALDLSRRLNGGQLHSYDFAALRTAAQASACRNRANLGGLAGGDLCAKGRKKAAVTFELGTTTPGAYGTPDYFTAYADQDGHYLGGATAGSVPDAVRVSASTEVSFGLARALPGGGIDSGGATRSAIATSDANACFKVGAVGAALDASQSRLLKGLVGGVLDDVNLTAIGYDGLVTANPSIPLLGLATALHVGSVDELVGLDDLTVAQLFVAAATALRNQGDTVNANVLDALALSGKLDRPITIGQLIDLSSASDAALQTKLNIVELVTGGVFVANGDAAIATRDLGLDLGISDLSVDELHVTQRPQKACGQVGRATARSSQVQIDVTGKLVDLNVSIPGLVGVKVNADVSLHVKVGDATGVLASTSCGKPDAVNPDRIGVSVTSGLAAVSLGLTNLVVRATVLILPINVLTGSTVVTGGPSTPSPTVTFALPPDQYGRPKASAPGGLGLDGSTATQTDLHLLGISLPLGSLLNPILAPLLGAVNGLLLKPLGDLLGLKIGGADVFPSTPRPTCSVPRLVG